MCQIFPLDFEIGKEYASLSEKNGCFSACILALFQLHALHWMLHTSTLLSEFEGLGDKGCSALPGVWFTRRQHQWWPWHARAIILLHHSSPPAPRLLLTRISLFSFLSILGRSESLQRLPVWEAASPHGSFWTVSDWCLTHHLQLVSGGLCGQPGQRHPPASVGCVLVWGN